MNEELSFACHQSRVYIFVRKSSVEGVKNEYARLINKYPGLCLHGESIDELTDYNYRKYWLGSLSFNVVFLYELIK